MPTIVFHKTICLHLLSPTRVGTEGSELSTFVLKLAYGKVVGVDCSPARLVRGATTNQKKNNHGILKNPAELVTIFLNGLA